MGITKDQLLMAVSSLKQYSDDNINRIHQLWLHDFKKFGENSFVFNNKEIYNELMSDYELCMRDTDVNGLCLDYANTINEAGIALSVIYFGDGDISSYETVSSIIQDSIIMSYILDANSDIIKNKLALIALYNSTESMEPWAATDYFPSNSKTAMQILIDSKYGLKNVTSCKKAMVKILSTVTSINVFYSNRLKVGPYFKENSDIIVSAAKYAHDAAKLSISSLGAELHNDQHMILSDAKSKDYSILNDQNIRTHFANAGFDYNILILTCYSERNIQEFGRSCIIDTLEGIDVYDLTGSDDKRNVCKFASGYLYTDNKHVDTIHCYFLNAHSAKSSDIEDDGNGPLGIGYEVIMFNTKEIYLLRAGS